MRYKIGGIFLGVCFLCACATSQKYDQKLNQQIGKTEMQLIADMGQPMYQKDLANGDKILTYVYKAQQVIAEPNYYYDMGLLDEDEEFDSFTYGGNEIPDGTLLGETVTDYCKTTFYLKNDVVTSWRWTGNACVAI